MRNFSSAFEWCALLRRACPRRLFLALPCGHKKNLVATPICSAFWTQARANRAEQHGLASDFTEGASADALALLVLLGLG